MRKLVAALIILIGIHAESISAAEKVRVGVPQQVIHWMTFPLAYKKGFFKEEGLDAEIVRILGPSGRSALVSGDIDYYTTRTDTGADDVFDFIGVVFDLSGMSDHAALGIA